ncbi:YjdF family protein [Pendulispora brunnea]|uniref:YjdF family protein n=1 Tax=Pendulispora brunnea TaxID=2905690 RepID=A0ABZ2JZH6_9BACT
MRGKFTVFYEAPFWVGVAEREDDDGLSIARVVFGAEPTGAELRDWALQGFRRMQFRRGAFCPDDVNESRPRNPKRAQREASRASSERGISTRAQDALKAALEANAVEREVLSREARLREAERRWDLRVARRKEKHRGH